MSDTTAPATPEQIAQVREHFDRDLMLNAHDAGLLLALLDHQAAALDAAKASAWDEGREHGHRDAMDYHLGDGCGPDTWDCTCPNPYRSTDLAQPDACEGE